MLVRLLRPCIVVGIVAVHSFLSSPPTRAQQLDVRPTAGILEHPIEDVWITHAKVVVQPGEVLEDATLSLKDGKIEQVGKGLTPPAGARAIDLQGKTIYPGFVDLGWEADAAPVDASRGAPHWNSEIVPQRSMATDATNLAESLGKLRNAGITTALVAPKEGIIKGTSAVVFTDSAPLASSLIQAQSALHVRLTVARGRGRDGYPGSPMGAVTLARQTFYDADWYSQAIKAHKAQQGLPKPEQNDALEALANWVDAGKPIIFDALNEQYALRADAFAREFGLKAILRGSGQEYQLLDAIARTGRPVIVPLNFPKPPRVQSAEAALDAELEELMHWELAPENPGRIAKAHIPFVLTSQGLADPSQFVAQIRKAIQRGLDPNLALESITTTPAGMLQLGEQLGTLKPGAWANLVVTNGELWDEKTKIEEVWVRGQRPANAIKNERSVDGKWSLALTETRKADGSTTSWPSTLEIEISDSTKRVSVATLLPKPADTAPNPEGDAPKEGEAKEGAADKKGKRKQDNRTEWSTKKWSEGTLQGQFSAKGLVPEVSGIAMISLAWVPDPDKGYFIGKIDWPDGAQHSIRGAFQPAEATKPATSDAKTDAPADSPNASKQDESKKEESSKDDSNKKEVKEITDKSKKPDATTLSTLRYPFASLGRQGIPAQPDCYLIQNTTLWTCGPSGTLKEADMLVRKGIIEAVGIDLPVPPDAIVVDGSAFEVSPGLIDCHSHMATDSGVNEATQAVTAEVRIGDFVNAEDVTIYRQLAGGLTSANVLHGSANPIGGQNQVIKLRWGGLYDDLKFKEAPAGIKFALGENVKQSNAPTGATARPARYPQSRMGVEQIFRDRFNAAKEYDRERKAWLAAPQGLPPRRDLELDALAEILRGERWIHCHSYRQDEILALLRVLEDYGITIGSLQHILEGYKVADAIAKHGGTASSFSDWWAYKLEVYDAIPHNGALMHQLGIAVSFNSDDAELGRHMNHEAAKAVKYGGVEPHEALKFVTLNPAKQLRIDAYVGSLEPGKHADFVLWSGSPLSLKARCEQTWIDGRKYFDRQEDLVARQSDRELHRKLIQKVLDSGESQGDRSVLADDPSRLWPNHDEYCHGHHDEHDDQHAHNDVDHEEHHDGR